MDHGAEAATLLSGFAVPVAAIGTAQFDGALLRALARVAVLDHLTILTHRPPAGLALLGLASRADEGLARSLTRDYVSRHHAQDPNFEELLRPGWRRRVVLRHHDPARLTSRAYEARFFTKVGIVDKLSLLWRSGDTGYYANLYRTHRSGPFTAPTIRALSAAAPFIASLIHLHAGRRRLDAALDGGSPLEVTTRIVALLNDRLTERERSVLAQGLMGLRTEGIALEMGVRASSVATFRKRAYAKLGITSQGELFARALRSLAVARGSAQRVP